MPQATNFLAFNRIKAAKASQRYTMLITAMTVPMENTAFTFTSLLNTYKYGMIKTLRAIRLAIIPLFPNIIVGKERTHAKIIELMGISDHVKLPDSAISQIRQTTTPMISVSE